MELSSLFLGLRDLVPATASTLVSHHQTTARIERAISFLWAF